MKFTSDYRRVMALFDTPSEKEVKYQEVGKDLEFEFQVGPFVYNIQFTSYGLSHGNVEVEFKLIGIEASDEDLVGMFSRLEKREVSLDEAQHEARDMVHNHSREILGITGQYSLKIFGTFINIVKDYVEKYHPKCIQFTSGSQKRTNIYHNMFKRAFPKANMQLKPLGNVTVKFVVCFV